MERLRHGFHLALFCFVTSGIFVLSLPQPSKIGVRSRWETERTHREFEAWGRPFGWSAEDVDRLLWPVASGASTVIAVLRLPFEKWAGYIGFYQGWRMFSTPRSYARSLEVSLRREGSDEWTPLYETRSRARAWRRRELDQNRLRKLVSRGLAEKPSRHREDLKRWLADRAREDFPDGTELRIQVYKITPPEPAAFASGAPMERNLRDSWIVPLRPR